jgi:MFS family permease
LSCVQLIGSAADPPLWYVLLLWSLAGAGGAYQLAAAAAFVQALRPATRAGAFGLAQSGLYAVQGLGILAGGAVAQAIGAPLAVGLIGRPRPPCSPTCPRPSRPGPRGPRTAAC